MIYIEHDDYCTWYADRCIGESGIMDAPCNLGVGYCENPNDPNCFSYSEPLFIAETAANSGHAVHPELAKGLTRPPKQSRPRASVVKDFDDSIVVTFRKEGENEEVPKHYAKLIFFRGRIPTVPTDEPRWEERRIGYEVLTPSDEEAEAVKVADHVYDLTYRGETYRIITLANSAARPID